jgi:hypothetical protein
MVQRFLSAKSKKTAQISLILNSPLLFLIISLCCFIGLILYANFFKCDPLTDKITNPNQLVTYYVINNLKNIPGISGLFLGSLFCGKYYLNILKKMKTLTRKHTKIFIFVNFTKKSSKVKEMEIKENKII